MANGQLLQMINRISEELSSSECSRLAFLCGSLDTHSCAPDVRELLGTRVSRGEVDHLYLTELMFRMKRFDLLRKVLMVNKHEVERDIVLGCRTVVPEYRLLMADVSEDMGTEDLQSVQFLLSGTLPRERMQNVQNFLDVVVELEKLNRVSSERVDFIEQCLRNIGRVDLARRVSQYQKSVGTSQHQSVVPLEMDEHRRLRTPSCAVPSTPLVAYSSRQGRSQDLNTPQRVRTPVSESRRSYCQVTQSPVDEYRLQADGPGVCVIIDCVGSDGDMLEQTFSRLHFKVILHKWLGVGETLSLLRDVSRQMDTQQAGALACCIISRGTSTDLLATDSHDVGIRLDSVRRLFNSDSCPALAGKPKLFFVQSYSVPEVQRSSRVVHRDEDLETDGPAVRHVELVPTDADIFWSHCWTEEQQLEGTCHQSVYLHALSQTLLKGQRRRTHLVDVHTEINGVIYDHNKRSPGASYNINLRHTLRKNLYLL